MKSLPFALLAVACTWSAAALADETEPPKRGVQTLETIVIKERVPRPLVAVDVGRRRPTLTLTELRQPFLDRIEKAIEKDPF